MIRDDLHKTTENNSRAPNSQLNCRRHDVRKALGRSKSKVETHPSHYYSLSTLLYHLFPNGERKGERKYVHVYVFYMCACLSAVIICAMNTYDSCTLVAMSACVCANARAVVYIPQEIPGTDTKSIEPSFRRRDVPALYHSLNSNINRRQEQRYTNDLPDDSRVTRVRSD